MKQELAKLNLTDDDVLIMRGDWSQDSMRGVAALLSAKGKNNICIVIPEENSLETMGIKEFYAMLKTIEKRIEESNGKETSETD